MQYLSIGKGENIIFLHGWGGGIDSFEWIADFFCDFRCVFVDLHSLQVGEKALTLDDYAQGVIDLLCQLGIEKAVFVGHSFGGRVATLLSATTSLARAIVLVDSAGLKPRRGLKYCARKLKYSILKLCKRDLSKCGSPDYRALDSVTKATFKNIVNEHLEKYLHMIYCATLIIWGKQDKETPFYMAKKLKKRIKNSEIVVLRGGHFAYIDDKWKFIAVLGSFCRSVYANLDNFDCRDSK
ncbi:MAG: alpha/beta hydrolase, partial [Clostridia bacterium]